MHPYICVCVSEATSGLRLYCQMLNHWVFFIVVAFLLTALQDNRYDNQRYMLKAGSVTDESNPDDVFDVSDTLAACID